jgi:hypothetical protein
MGTYRTYFDKNTTILSNSELNTARNPITQLYYGRNSDGARSYTRFLFHLDVTELISRVSGGTIMGEMKHVLKMKNTSFFDGELVGADFDAKKRAYSFDLILSKLYEFWDEGAGYDIVPDIFESPNNNAYILGPANWLNRTTTQLWSAPGVFDYDTVFPDIIATQHFEFGNEDIEIDITDEINALISGGTNNGYCISFREDYENASGTTQQQYVGFYSRHTNTYYEPFVETSWNDLIEDDRGYFFMGRMNRIFYYAYVDGKLINLTTLPTVEIFDENGASFITGTAIQLSKGIYYFEFMVPENNDLDKFQFKDTWTLSYDARTKIVNGKITLLADDNFLPMI